MSNHKNQIDHMESLAKGSARSGTVQDKASYQLKMLGYKGSLQDMLSKYEHDIDFYNDSQERLRHEFTEVKAPSVVRRVLSLFGGSAK